MPFIYFIIPFLLHGLFVRVDSILLECVDGVSLSVATDGSCYVIDRTNNTVIRYNDGKVKTIGGTGWSNDGFDNPTDVNSSFILDVYITDKNNNRIQRFDRNLSFIESLTKNSIINSESFYPQSCAVSLQGEIFAIDRDNRKIVKIDKNRKILSEFGSNNSGSATLRDPIDISVSPNDAVFVMDQNTIVEYDLYGNYILSIPLEQNDHWRSIASTADHIIAISSERIQFYAISGEYQFELRPMDISGFSIDEFRDSFMIDTVLYILTPKALLSCSLIQN